MKSYEVISKLSDLSLTVNNLPFRKKPCLSIKRGNHIFKVASFNNEKSAEEFIKALEEMFKIPRKTE